MRDQNNNLCMECRDGGGARRDLETAQNSKRVINLLFSDHFGVSKVGLLLMSDTAGITDINMS